MRWSTLNATLLAAAALCMLSATKTHALHCGVRTGDGTYAICPEDCDVDTDHQPVCKDGIGNYHRGWKGEGCYLIRDQPGEGNSKQVCPTHCSPTNGHAGAVCV
ncbi:hypothetical protein BCV69DRAFT_283702 [Microstroma glucosiphilum]|uniref:Uncharacterized protein n=1 Tax=Pseudomicrostroma glucosiphilum TaxID=1684307 RepID=A0A316U4H9_9BASI|nr:hypothetical protein BCV69DRAFT_283702 [Pseudomicrostroma glucosiphilum]PWN20162.1 hypothetical protein BCV69DRAFT_283702 [Pseudomicrostroma glucosiphilum]